MGCTGAALPFADQTFRFRFRPIVKFQVQDAQKNQGFSKDSIEIFLIIMYTCEI